MARLLRLTWLGAPLLCGCQVLGGFHDLEGGEATGAATEAACAVLPAAKDDELGFAVMARVDIPDATCVWMDRTEVTVEQYQRWLDEAAFEELEWEPTWCRWKAARSDPAATADDACKSSVMPFDLQPFAPRKPMRCVDFCDAEAFCRWAGKHLCYDESALGIQGPRGYAHEWLLACNNSQTTVYPWGNGATDSACNTGQSAESCITENPTCGPNLAGQGAGCANGHGIQDLIGNVAEWTFGCNFVSAAKPLEPSNCLTRGGGYDDELGACDQEHTIAGDSRLPNLGFRCCADLTPSEELLLQP